MFELLPVVDRLAHPERFGGAASDGFTVVLPHFPGFALSPPPPARLTPRDIATLWHKLMTEVLSYPRYAAHGGDWGSVITAWLAYDHPQEVAAIHLTMAAMHPGDTFAADPPDSEEQEYIAAARARLRGETAYQQIHGEKPDTLAFALADSPVGLGAWMLEKFYRWSDPDLLPELDAMLATISAYWFTYSHPADWLYHKLLDRSAYTLPPGSRIETPSAFCLFPHDIAAMAPDRWLKRLFNVSRVTRALRGGHFPGLEQPAYLADDIRSALASAR